MIEPTRIKTYAQIVAESRPHREKLFALLRAAHVIELVIYADGEGDEGRITDWNVTVPREYSDEPIYGEQVHPLLDRPQTEALFAQKITDTMTAEGALYEFANMILDYGRDTETIYRPDWVNGTGGTVELHVDLTAPEPIVRAEYSERVVSLEPSGTFTYHALDGIEIPQPETSDAKGFD